MMKCLDKCLIAAAAIGAGVIAAFIGVPNLSSESSNGSPGSLFTPAQAETLKVARPEQTAQDRAQLTTFPGGATTLRESYSDWQVSCSALDQGKRCSMVQQQTNSKSRQRVLTIELQRNGDGMQGALVLPFGIALENGVTLQVDEAPAGNPLRFRTCVPAGCLVPLSFDAALVEALGGGGALKVNAVSDGDKSVAFSISLKGFSAAHNRIKSLLE